MARPEKTVFISYRRKDISWALAVYHYLTKHDYDVFFDYKSIPSGDFEQIIIGNIKARAHFLVILTPSALDRCSEPGDWFRREIETAISEKRNIIPLFFDDFNFGDPSVAEKLTGKMAQIKRYNGLDVPQGYFDEAMERLCERYLDVTLDAVLHPVPVDVQKVVKEQQVAADRAILRGEDPTESHELAQVVAEAKAQKEREDTEHRLAEENARKEKERQIRGAAPEQTRKKGEDLLAGMAAPWEKWVQNVNVKLVGIGGVILLAISGLIFAGNYFAQNPPTAILPTGTIPPLMTALESPVTNPTVPLSETPLPTPTLGVGSLMRSKKDGMNMVYIPAGEFEMGSETGEPDERPVHTVSVEAYWIDQSEITNAMYARCVQAGACGLPVQSKSFTREIYYGNPEFDDYPALYVSWEAADAYCEWAGRRLPSEAEWEKAAAWDEGRHARRIYPWGDSFEGDKLNFCDANCTLDRKNPDYDDGYADTAPVGSYPAGMSSYDAYDLAGNVWEWVSDWYDMYPGGDGSVSDDFGQTHRVVRGGSWFFSHETVFRSANRAPQDPAKPNDAIGFRCALSASE